MDPHTYDQCVSTQMLRQIYWGKDSLSDKWYYRYSKKMPTRKKYIDQY